MTPALRSRTLGKVLLTLLLSLLPFGAGAQFYSVGEEPWGQAWLQRESAHFRLIYPAVADSLAKEYILGLEAARGAVARSAGMTPGGLQKGLFPVLLHPNLSTSNGVVTWAPRRMELFTTPPAYGPEPMSWASNLCLHESRHVAQMQLGYRPKTRWLGWIFGEIWPGAAAGIYYTEAMMEGDAVLAETALSASGRGRTADFLNYYAMAWDSGDKRSWARWKGGSHKRYTPNVYAQGYMYYGGLRYLYGTDLCLGAIADQAAEHPLRVLSYKYRYIKEKTGRRLYDLVRPVGDTLYQAWHAQLLERAPFTPKRPLVRTPAYYTVYSSLVPVGGGRAYAVRSGLDRASVLVCLDSAGREKTLRPFASDASRLRLTPDAKALVWSEVYEDLRWNLRSRSVVRRMDLNTGRVRDLSRDSRWFNPAPSPDGAYLAVVEYAPDGAAAVVLLDAQTGAPQRRFRAPDGLQPVEPAWLGPEVYVSGVSEEGMGLFRIGKGQAAPADGPEATGEAVWEVLLPARPVKIQDLQAVEESLSFTCDRNGVNELYFFRPDSRELFQQTSTRYGGKGYRFSPDGKTLWFSAESADGTLPAVIRREDLLGRREDWDERYLHPLAEVLSAQERELALREKQPTGRDGAQTDGTMPAAEMEETSSVSASAAGEARPYSGIGRLFCVHSWAPVYVNVENALKLEYDLYYDILGVGLSAFSQNLTGTLTAGAGWCFHHDPDGGPWRHSGHVNLAVKAWYPVIEARFDIGDRSARRSQLEFYSSDGQSAMISLRQTRMNAPYMNGNLSVSVPLSRSVGGRYFNLTPKVELQLDNDSFSASAPVYRLSPGGETVVGTFGIKEFSSGGFAFSGSVRPSVSGYVMRATPASGVYPRLGIGLQAGVSARLWHPLFSPAAYVYAYGYLPGFFPTHGWRLTASFQAGMGRKSHYYHPAALNVLPRGLASRSALLSLIAQYNPVSGKVTAEYGLPFSFGDIDVWDGMLYIRKFIFTPHFDAAFCRDGQLWSAGASLVADVKSLFRLGANFRLGLTASYSGGSLPASYALPLSSWKERLYVAPVFSFSL